MLNEGSKLWSTLNMTLCRKTEQKQPSPQKKKKGSKHTKYQIGHSGYFWVEWMWVWGVKWAFTSTVLFDLFPPAGIYLWVSCVIKNDLKALKIRASLSGVQREAQADCLTPGQPALPCWRQSCPSPGDALQGQPSSPAPRCSLAAATSVSPRKNQEHSALWQFPIVTGNEAGSQDKPVTEKARWGGRGGARHRTLWKQFHYLNENKHRDHAGLRVHVSRTS